MKDYPKDWFDLSERQFADFGAMCFLAGLVREFNQLKLAQTMFALEPALRLGQYKLFYSNGFPRAFITWAGLDSESERKFAIDDVHFGSEKWNSGQSIWIVDMVAPFGHGAAVHDLLSQQIFQGEASGLKKLRARRDFIDGKENRISEWKRDREGRVKFKSFSKSEFQSKLKEAV